MVGVESAEAAETVEEEGVDEVIVVEAAAEEEVGNLPYHYLP